MGVSVSASTAIIVAGLFFAVTAFYPVASNGFERVSAAGHDATERALDQQNTDVEVLAAENGTDANGTAVLRVNVSNEGTTGQAVDGTTLVVDNEHVDLTGGNVTTSVAGDADTDLWLSGETLNVTVTNDALSETTVADAERVVVVTEGGVSDAADVGGGA